jgi:hypothetical protein
VTEATIDGTANLMALDLPPDRALAISRRINHIARSLRRAGEHRTMDQLRADVFLDILEGRADESSSGSGSVDIQVDLTTLIGLADAPAELAGYGPVVADIARKVAEDQRDGSWRYAVRTPNGSLHTGTTRRRPTAAQQRDVVARNQVCVFPGCRMPARSCDLDHRIPWSEGGPTTVEHLAPLCRHDHRIRHRAGWRYRQAAGGGFLWTSPLGHRYATSGRPP